MLIIGHNASLNNIDGLRPLTDDATAWGPLIPKADYLAQFGKIKAWELYILPHQLQPLALEQLAEAMTKLQHQPGFDNLEWLSLHFPTSPQPHHLTGEISQEKWRPFYQLLQVLDRFEGAKEKNLNFHILAEASLAEVWHFTKEKRLDDALAVAQKSAKGQLSHAYKLRDLINPKLHLTVENNPPYHNKAHKFHLAGLFPQEIRQWQLSGVEVCLDIQHASLVHWYRERYGYDGPIPALNFLHHRSSLGEYLDLDPLYIHAAGAPDTPESLHYGTSIGGAEDDVDWEAWMSDLRELGQEKDLPVIIELENGHLPDSWPSCQTSADYLKRL